MATAIITPITENGIDYDAFGKLIDWQIEQGIDAIVVCGTTGEASTLTDNEKLELIRRAKEYVSDSMTIIAGTGSNCTEHAVWLSEEAQKRGADAVLAVSPYYNKATEEGLFAHYASIADAVTAATSPMLSLWVFIRSPIALQMVIDIFEPVSPSGTGNTLRSFIVLSLLRMDAPALSTIRRKVSPEI